MSVPKCQQRKTIALIFIFLLAGSECARLHDLSEESITMRRKSTEVDEAAKVGEADIRFRKNSQKSEKSGKSKFVSRWRLGFGNPVCPMTYNVTAIQERYHVKLTKLFVALQEMEDSRDTEGSSRDKSFMWKLREIGLRSKGLTTCLRTASKKPELAETLKDPDSGLTAVMAKVMHRVMDQLKRRDLINLQETPTCKIQLASINAERIKKWEEDAKVDVAKSTQMLLFGADCDAEAYMSSPGISNLARKVLLKMNDFLINLAQNATHESDFAEVLEEESDMLETLPKEHDDDPDDVIPNASALVQRQSWGDVGTFFGNVWNVAKKVGSGIGWFFGFLADLDLGVAAWVGIVIVALIGLTWAYFWIKRMSMMMMMGSYDRKGRKKPKMKRMKKKRGKGGFR